jgi:hypothetical protein
MATAPRAAEGGRRRQQAMAALRGAVIGVSGDQGRAGPVW